MAGHIAGSNGGYVGNATVLYLVVSLTVQRFALLRRVGRYGARSAPRPARAAGA